MQLTLSTPALYIIHQLMAHGYEAYIVGGAVRDVLLGKAATTDYDFTTNATPEQIQTVFPKSFYENQFGTVSVTHQHLSEELNLAAEPSPPIAQAHTGRIIDVLQATKIHESLQPNPNRADLAETDHYHERTYQITTYRADEVYDNFRHPTGMRWGQTLQEDLDRRDFTINAMAFAFDQAELNQHFVKISSQIESLLTVSVEIIDPHHGQTDLAAGLIRTVGDADTRFQEDALRMLRAIRFSVQLDMQIEPQTWASLSTNAALIEHISGERVRDELLKMLASNHPADAIERLDQTHLLDLIIPELQEGKGVQQGGHHTTDVWTHSLDALRTCPATDPIVRLATLLHDVAKPRTQGTHNGTITFYNHEIVGARLVKQIGNRLRLSRKDIDRLYILVRYHMFHYQPFMTDAAIRRFMRKVGLENIDDMLDLREADRLGSGARKTSWRLEEMKQRMIDQLHQPMDLRDLAINGSDLMTELGLKPGPVLGDLLHALFEQVLDQPELNTKNQLLAKAKELLNAAQTVDRH